MGKIKKTIPSILPSVVTPKLKSFVDKYSIGLMVLSVIKRKQLLTDYGLEVSIRLSKIKKVSLLTLYRQESDYYSSSYNAYMIQGKPNYFLMAQRQYDGDYRN